MTVRFNSRNVRTVNTHLYTSIQRQRIMLRTRGTYTVKAATACMGEAPNTRGTRAHTRIHESSAAYGSTACTTHARRRLSLQEPSTINHRPPLTRGDRYTWWLTACLAVKLLPPKLSATFRSPAPPLARTPASDTGFARYSSISNSAYLAYPHGKGIGS